MRDERRMSERTALTVGSDPELVIQYRDPVVPASGYVVVDTLAPGVAFGGVRIRPDLKWTDLAPLARIGTIRYQLARVTIGGARIGLDYAPDAPDVKDVLARFLSSIRPLLASTVSVGPDVNVSEPLLTSTLERIGAPWRMEAVHKRQNWPLARWQRYQEILDERADGTTLRQLQIAYSVAQSVIEMADHLSMRNRSVAVIGSGQLSLTLARLLHGSGANVVAIGGAAGGVHSAKGVDQRFLSDGVDLRDSIDNSHTFITRDEAYALPVDILVLAGSGDPVTIDNVGRVRASLIVEAAARSLTPEAEKVLVASGRPVLPSFAVTIGAILIADSVLRGEANTREEVLAYLSSHARSTVKEIARLSSTLRISLRRAGVRLAFHRWDVAAPPQAVIEEPSGKVLPAEDPDESL